MKKITVIGSGNVGATAAQGIALRNLAQQVILLDILDGVPQGKALDMWESAPVEGFDSSVIGTNDYADTSDSDIIVITAGLARKPGMSRDDLLHKNAEIMKSCVEQSAPLSPNAIYIIVSNPLDVMTYVALKTSGFPKHRVVGMAGILDSARFRLFIAQELKVSVRDVQALVLGGHGDSMVPLVRYSTVSGIQISELIPEDRIEALVDRARHGGIEIVNYLKTGSAYYAPAASAVEMVEAIATNNKRILPCAAFLDGEYGLHNTVCGVPVKLGSEGIEEIVALRLTESEQSALNRSAHDVTSNIAKLSI
ncbi:MAG: malate dehydrogenase [Ignavibacteriaceae bacterium]|nr:malate dehydrogenase [Ignavibacteriaceae bacterium]